MKDSHFRVAVVVTDGVNAIVGKSPQNIKRKFNSCDLMKGHAKIGESFVDAAKRETYEECGLVLSNIERLSDELDYIKDDKIIFFVSYFDKLPDISQLKCKSFFEHNGRRYPEIARYLEIPLDKLRLFLYRRLSNLIEENNIIEKNKNI